MSSFRARFFWVCLFLIASFVVGCSPKSTPPGANSIYGGVDAARFSYHYWEEGLSILIWHDLSSGGEGCSGTGSTEDPVFRLECDVESADGRSFSWKVHTQDGVTAEVWIEDQSYDLAQGNMFLVGTEDSGFQVEQLQRDFSELEPSVDTISALSSSDPDVAEYIARVGTESVSPEPDLPPQVDTAVEPGQDAESIISILPEALANQDFEAVQELMGEPFIIGYWLSEGLALSPAEAAEQLQTNLLPNPSKATFTADPGQLPDLGPFDPWRSFGPDVAITDLVFSRGWGMDGSAEAILAIAQSPEGNPYWHGVIFAGGGFTELPGPTSEASSPSPTIPPEPETPTLMHPLAGLLYRDGQEIWIIDEKGEPLFVFDEPSARISADGRFVLYQPEYDPDIWLADLTTGERRNLTESSGRYNGLAQWWPGQPDTVIFGSSEELGPGFGYPTTVHTDGSDYQVLDPERGGPLALSADGELLAYGGFAESARIVRRGSEPVDFNPADYGLDVDKVLQPAWSPDGRRLAWIVSGDQERHGWSSGVAVFDLEDNSADLFHTYTAVGGGSVPHYLSWNPGGDWLAFVTFNERAEDGRRPNLWIAHPDGQGEIRLGTAFESVWSPDGSQIAYSLYDETQEAYQVWIYDTETGEQTQILSPGTAAVDWLVPTDQLMQTLRQYSPTQ